MPASLRPAAFPLVGRRVELDVIAARVAAGAALVTITGPPGVGKSRLMVEAGRALAAEGREAFRVELGEARDADGVCDAVALALGVQHEPPTSRARDDAPTRIGRALAARGEILLLLDELERVIAHAPATVGRWLELAPEAVVLATSRERLGLDGEVVHELAPLALPPESGELEGEAVELLVRAAQRGRADWVPSPAEAPYVAALVRELDGLPLALELAAAKLAIMGPRALLHRLKGGAARGPLGALDAAIDASWVALAPWEKDALAHASVFRGGFSVDAAEAVIDLRARAGAPPVLDVVLALRDKSLLHAREAPGGAGEVYLGMLASVRAFAARRLDPGARDEAERRHAAYVVAAAEAWTKGLLGREGAAMRARILAERDDLLAVIDRVLGRGPVTARTAEPALRALLVLAPVLVHEGALGGYARLLDPVLAATRDSGADPRLLAHALALRGSLLRQRGEVRAGSRDLVRALAAAQTLDDVPLRARVTLELGRALASRGELAAAREHAEEALCLFRDVGDENGVGDAYAELGALAQRDGHGDAAGLVARALAVHRAQPSPLAEVADLLALGELALDQGRIQEGKASLASALATARAVRDRRGEALAVGLVGLADQLEGDAASARAGYERAAAQCAAIGLAPLEARFVGALGVLCREEGRTAEAFASLAAALRLLGDDADVRRAAILLAHRGALDASIGRSADAAQGFALAEEKLRTTADPAARAVLAIARGDADAFAGRSADVALARRCRDREARAPSREPPPPDDALVVGAGGLWFRAPGGERVALDRRKPLALLLDRLARERVDRPGAALAWDALLGAAWPGERVRAIAGAHRVRVAVSTLRKLGLKDVLVTRDDGYLLAPGVAAFRLP